MQQQKMHEEKTEMCLTKKRKKRPDKNEISREKKNPPAIYYIRVYVERINRNKFPARSRGSRR